MKETVFLVLIALLTSFNQAKVHSSIHSYTGLEIYSSVFYVNSFYGNKILSTSEKLSNDIGDLNSKIYLVKIQNGAAQKTIKISVIQNLLSVFWILFASYSAFFCAKFNLFLFYLPFFVKLHMSFHLEFILI